MKTPSYVVSYQKEHFHKGTRYHWVICGTQNCDEMVSWGYAETQEQAEKAAENEIKDLISGLTKGGRVLNTAKTFTRS
jgi:hypothetical protein